MITLEHFRCQSKNHDLDLRRLSNFFEAGTWVQLLAPKEEQVLNPPVLLPAGPGIVIKGSGTSGQSHECFLPCNHLDQSAESTADWLRKKGFNPTQSMIVNPLPLHHVSGFMPWWRSRLWSANYLWIDPALIRNPALLEDSLLFLQKSTVRERFLSLVPTQLRRLLKNPIGLRWLKEFSLIWVGGSVLPQALENEARQEKLPLSPCYGATETVAMISSLSPNEFLEGKNDCGTLLKDVQVRLADDGSLEVKTPRLSIGYLSPSGVDSFCGEDGWWHTGDEAQLSTSSSGTRLKIVARKDNAIISGGETVFPEELESRFMKQTFLLEAPIENILFLPIQDDEWGHRIVGLVKWSEDITGRSSIDKRLLLDNIIKEWLPPEKPINWLTCQKLQTNQAGKWDRARWIEWIKLNQEYCL